MKLLHKIILTSLLSSLCLFDCVAVQSGSGIGSSDTHAGDPVKWIDQFREFRAAVYQNDRKKVKSFFAFPIINEGNGLWWLAYEGTKKYDEVPPETKPFTEQDFDRYFSKIFSKMFINAILKIKTEELNKTGHFETIDFKEQKDCIYKLYAEFDKKERTLTLNLNLTMILRDENGKELDDHGESSKLYEFRVAKDGTLKFDKVMLAG